MTNILKKCKGCGKQLSLDKNEISYTPDSSFTICQRCWKLRHYGINNGKILSDKEVLDELVQLKITKRDYIVIVSDFLSINVALWERYKDYPNVFFIFNKVDKFLHIKKYDFLHRNISSFLDRYEFKTQKFFLTSTFNNFGMKKLNEFLMNTDRKNKIFFLGNTNAGKSSLINKLISINQNRTEKLTTSGFLNTTLSFKKVKIYDHQIIDCPGFDGDKNILKIICDSTKLLPLITQKKIKSKFFKVTKEQVFFLDKLCFIVVQPKENSGISFFLNINLEPKCCKLEKLDAHLKTTTITIKDDVKYVETEIKIDQASLVVQIDGLGHIICKNIELVKIKVPEGVGIVTLKDRLV